MLLATVVIDPPGVVALAAIFVLCMGRLVARGSPLWASLLVGASVGGWMGACFGVMAFRYPAWMLCYLVDPRALPAALWYPAFLALMIGSGALGAALTHRFLRTGRRRAAVLLPALMLGLWLALFALTFPRYLLVGTFDEFWSGRALPLSAQPAVLRDFNRVTLLTAVPLLALLLSLLARSRRAPRDPGL